MVFRVYEWDHENSVPKRILPTSPPPPRWCWGSLDVVLKESESIDFNTEKEGSSVGTANESVEDSDRYELYLRLLCPTESRVGVGACNSINLTWLY